MIKKALNKAGDFYFKKPILWDAIVVVLLWVISLNISYLLSNLNLPLIKVLDKGTLLNYLSNLVETNVTLAGFIIAALTILVTVKSSLKARGYEDAENALEYIFSTKHYASIIKVFVKSISELVLILIILYVVWLVSENINEKNIYRVLIFSTFGLLTSLLRSLFVLFNVLSLENINRV